MNTVFSLSQLASGQRAQVLRVDTPGAMGRRLRELGFVPGTKITCLGAAPAGTPVRYALRGAVIALRKKDAETVCVEAR